jgi:UPF0716 protein FxsA
MAQWIIATIVLYPVAEIAVFAIVASFIGLGSAFALLLGTTVVGLLVLRWAGGARWSRFRVAVGTRNITAIEADGVGVLTVLGGFLLVLPGFISDLIGLLLLIAPLRRALATAVGRAIRRRQRHADSIVDLEPDEWRQVPDRELDDRRHTRDPK